MYYGPDAVLGAKDITENNNKENPCPCGNYNQLNN